MHNNTIAQDPFGKLLDDLFNRSISEIVGTDFTHDSPSANITEEDQHFSIQLAAPGLEKSDFKITIEKDFLLISADKKKSDEVKSDFKRREFDYSKFSRKFRLPETIDKESIKAKYDLGLLIISMKKSENDSNKEITIDIN